MGEWVEKRFRDFVKLNRGFDLPNDQIIDGEYPVVASTNIKGFHNRYKINPPAVITGRSGSLGTVQYIDKKCVPLNTTLYVKDFKGNNPKFVYYYLQTMRLEAFNSGAGVPTLNQNHLHNIKLLIPDLPTQNHIVAILSTYDDAIENNNCRIALLEKAARELYREWFVRMRFPGYERAKFVNGLPEGWKIRKIGEVVRLQRGHDLPLVYVENGKYPVVGSSGIIAHHNVSTTKPPVIVLGRSGSVGNPQLYENECWVHNTALYAKKIYCEPLWVYFMLCQQDYSSFVGGSAVPTLNRNHVEAQKVLVPNKGLQKNFDSFVSKLFQAKSNLRSQSQNLARQRNLLLPRLMSGKLEV